MPSQVVQVHPPSNLFPYGNCDVVLLDSLGQSQNRKYSSLVFIHLTEFNSIYHCSGVDGLQTALQTIHDARPLLHLPPNAFTLRSICQGLPDS